MFINDWMSFTHPPDSALLFISIVLNCWQLNQISHISQSFYVVSPISDLKLYLYNLVVFCVGILCKIMFEKRKKNQLSHFFSFDEIKLKNNFVYSAKLPRIKFFSEYLQFTLTCVCVSMCMYMFINIILMLDRIWFVFVCLFRIRPPKKLTRSENDVWISPNGVVVLCWVITLYIYILHKMHDFGLFVCLSISILRLNRFSSSRKYNGAYSFN